MNFRSKEDIIYFSKLIFEMNNIPIFYIHQKGEVDISFPSTFVCNPIYSSLNDLITQLGVDNDSINIPVLRNTNFMEHFITIKIEEDHGNFGIWMLGPCLHNKVDEETIIGIVNDCQLIKKKEAIMAYYDSLSIINRMSLMNTGILATYLVSFNQLSITDVIQKNSYLTINQTTDINPDLYLIRNRQDISFHHSFEMEKAIFQCVKEGRKDALIEQLKVSAQGGKFGVLSKKSHIRSEKNLSVACITLATRYAIEGGLHPELAYTMSDLYIQLIEDLHKIEEVRTATNEALCDFADRVHRVKFYHYSKPINDCLAYIFQHLYEDFSISKLADVTNLHPNYLSKLFKKEVGITLSEYIINQKIEEAMKLLTNTKHTLSEIYTWLNFHDQSHFTKVFKKHTGTTPKQYRVKHG
ncbi:helix-turn-helix domain-containing protein [Gracilibacillus massiliensis]|uniref:helix-turn-helix domain-containing protein n=1 Tax=Gracilibacillus massiliensis TaxID=1564956 RepID=UPI00071CDE22|nr:helix-turn-helix domain-containing protein [Gracilibacillus massiliensis]